MATQDAMSIELRWLEAPDLLARVAEDVFDGPILADALAAFLADPNSHLCAAVEGGVVVGFVSALVYRHPDKAPILWINEAGVAPSHQRRGVGKALMRAMLARAPALGCAQAWVATEADNAAARALYRSAGGAETEGIVMAEWSLDGA